MKLLKKTGLLLLFVSFTQVCLSSDYSDTPLQGSKGNWGWSGSSAQMWFNNGTFLMINFVPKVYCKHATFGLTTNTDIKSIVLKIDDKIIRNVIPKASVLENGKQFCSFSLSDDDLRELKNGSLLKIDTDEDKLLSSLSGSALSINMAYGNCMKAVGETIIMPSRIARPKLQKNDLKQGKISKLTTTRIDGGDAITIFNGKFEKGDGQKIIEEITESGAILLILNSIGGLVSEAQQVGYFLRRNNISSMAGNVCASACVFTLAGGVNRYSLKQSKVGIHRSRIPRHTGSLEEGQMIAGDYIKYFKIMGIDNEIVEIALNTSSQNMRWLTANEMHNLHLTTKSHTANTQGYESSYKESPVINTKKSKRNASKIFGNYIRISLGHGTSIEVPKNWIILSDNRRITVDAAIEAMGESSEYGPIEPSSLNFVANLYDEIGNTIALVHTRFYMDNLLTQDLVRKLTSSQLDDLSAGSEKASVAAAQMLGARMINWFGSEIQVINGIYVLVNEYQQSDINNQGVMRVRVLDVWRMPHSFTFTLSYRESDAKILLPIIDHMANSLRQVQ